MTQLFEPLITVVVPSFNQGKFLRKTICSLIEQKLPIEIFVMDGGSTDGSVEIIREYQNQLAGWRSHQDNGQAAAINEGMKRGSAPYVCWLNSDDWVLPGALKSLMQVLEAHPNSPACYGRVWNHIEKNGDQKPVWVEDFNLDRLALRCIISQPGTLIRRSAWESVNGVDENLQLAMDYDLWWRLYQHAGPFIFVDQFVAVNREHSLTKTKTQRRKHYQEAIAVVKKHYGRVPLKWWLAQPYAVWYKSLVR